ncbi:MAG TPA: hypothetical protein VG166_04570 [Caulobacteraceae bacterium]|jgi:hypothetical protein|nr:hypothetical protein [Caulobacteraceae bacterium]
MVRVIVVEPFAHGWAVKHPTVDNSQLFSSGAKAEDAAMRLGARLADAGEPAEIHVYLRGGTLAGRFLCPAA